MPRTRAENSQGERIPSGYSKLRSIRSGASVCAIGTASDAFGQDLVPNNASHSGKFLFLLVANRDMAAGRGGRNVNNCVGMLLPTANSFCQENRCGGITINRL